MIKVDLDDTYEVKSVNEDLTHFSFLSILKDKSEIELHVEITVHTDPLLPAFLIWHLVR